MTEIACPRREDAYADRALDCETAIMPAFQELARQAAKAGWSEDDVAGALIRLAGSHIKAIISDRKTAQEIASARKTKL